MLHSSFQSRPLTFPRHVPRPCTRNQADVNARVPAGGAIQIDSGKVGRVVENVSELRKNRGVWSDVWRCEKRNEGPRLGGEPSTGLHASTDDERGPRKRLYLVDMHPLCYEGDKVRPSAVVEWMRLLFTQVTQHDPVIAVMDGERGNEYRQALMPNYKASRNKYRPLPVRAHTHRSPEADLRECLPLIHGFLALCHVPVVTVDTAEADDVVATLAQQALARDLRVVVASPDMDLRQLLSPQIHMLLPLPEFGRWSFYTLQHYVAQHEYSPSLELGMRCLLGDASDSIPGLPELAPGFGRKTALKLMKKHGSLDQLLNAAATRTVGKPYIQDALTTHAPALRRNFQVLSLRADVDVMLKEEWCRPRSSANDSLAFQVLREQLQRLQLSPQSVPYTS